MNEQATMEAVVDTPQAEIKPVQAAENVPAPVSRETQNTAPVPSQNQDIAMLEMIERIATNPDVQTDKMRAVLDMKMEMVNKDAEMAFNKAMVAAQTRMPQVEKLSQADKSKYAKLEYIDQQIRHIYTEEGFALSFDSRKEEDNTITYFVEVTHSAGHSKVKQLNLPIDKSGSKNDTQAVGSSTSYAERHLTKMVFNVIEKNVDDDANMGLANKIDQAQIEEIRRLMAETNTDEEKYIAFLKVKSVEDITQVQYQRATRELKDKKAILERRAQKQLEAPKNNEVKNG